MELLKHPILDPNYLAVLEFLFLPVGRRRCIGKVGEADAFWRDALASTTLAAESGSFWQLRAATRAVHGAPRGGGSRPYFFSRLNTHRNIVRSNGLVSTWGENPTRSHYRRNGRFRDDGYVPVTSKPLEPFRQRRVFLLLTSKACATLSAVGRTTSYVI